MSSHSTPAWAVSFPILLATCAFAAILDPKTDDSRIQGAWVAVNGEENGVDVGEGLRKLQLKIDFTAGRFNLESVLRFDPRVAQGKYTVHSNTRPPALDLQFRSDKQVTKTIYAIEGGILKICYAGKDGVRPRQFKTIKGSGQVLMVLERKKP